MRSFFLWLSIIPWASLLNCDAAPLFVAYSLREAATQLKRDNKNPEVTHLGGITRLAGYVHDREHDDIILIGLARPDLPSALIDDLVVALRARVLFGEWPLVSIDPMEDSDQTKLQRVRFDGHLENTVFGRDFLMCDVFLKQYSLALVENQPILPPYNRYLEKDIVRRIEDENAKLLSITWFPGSQGKVLEATNRGIRVNSVVTQQARFVFNVQVPYHPLYSPDEKQPEIFCIQDLKLCLESEDGSGIQEPSKKLAQHEYAEGWTAHLEEICGTTPLLRRLKVLYDMVALSEAIGQLSRPNYVGYLLNEYAVEKVETKQNWSLEELYGVVERSDGMRELIRLTGGIRLAAEIRRLNYGDLNALAKIVTRERPKPDALWWPVPIGGWDLPNLEIPAIWARGSHGTNQNQTKAPPGCRFVMQSVVLDTKTELSPLDSLKGFQGFSSVGGVLFETKPNGEKGDLKPLKRGILRARADTNALSGDVK